MSYKSSVESHNKALRLYKEIDKTYQNLEKGNIRNFNYKVENAITKVHELKKLISKINISDLKQKLSSEKIDKVKENISFFRQFTYFMERELHKIYFADKLQVPLNNYIQNLNIDKYELADYGSYDELKKLFISAITHRDRVLDYKNEIMRIIKGKMTQNEFNKIFSVLKRYIKRNYVRKKSKGSSFVGHSGHLRDPDAHTTKVPSKTHKQTGTWEHTKKGDISFIRKEANGDESERFAGMTTSEPPKEETQDEDGQRYVILQDGTKLPYERKHIGTGITTYIDKEGNEVYSYIHLSESFVSLDKYLKLLNS